MKKILLLLTTILLISCSCEVAEEDRASNWNYTIQYAGWNEGWTSTNEYYIDSANYIHFKDVHGTTMIMHMDRVKKIYSWHEK